MWHGQAATPMIGKFLADFLAAETRAWRGEEPLWKVFWGYGVLTSTVIAAFYVVAVYAGDLVLQQLLLPCFAVYTAWILVSVWRCAKNTQQGLWDLLARLLTVAWAGNTIMLLAFLQLDLVTKYLRR